MSDDSYVREYHPRPWMAPPLQPARLEPPKVPPWAFLGSRTVCSMCEVGAFKLGCEEDAVLTDETVNRFIKEMKDMGHVAAFLAATANEQGHAAAMLTRAGFKPIASWPGNACREVTLWFYQRRNFQPKKGGEDSVQQQQS